MTVSPQVLRPPTLQLFRAPQKRQWARAEGRASPTLDMTVGLHIHPWPYGAFGPLPLTGSGPKGSVPCRPTLAGLGRHRPGSGGATTETPDSWAHGTGSSQEPGEPESHPDPDVGPEARRTGQGRAVDAGSKASGETRRGAGVGAQRDLTRPCALPVPPLGGAHTPSTPSSSPDTPGVKEETEVPRAQK